MLIIIFFFQESDFLCLLGASYTFENEDSELKSDNAENIYPYEEDKDQKSSIYESDFLTEPGSYSTSENIGFEDQFPASEAPEDIRRNSESSNWEGIEAGSVKQYPILGVDYVPSPSTVKGWFGFGKEQAEEKTVESVIETLRESSFQSRKIAVEDENDLEELNNNEPQTEDKKEPESEFNSVPKKQSEASESEHILSPQATGWFGSRFTSYLGFGGEDTGLALLSKESNPPLQDLPNSVSSEEEPMVPLTEMLTEKEDTVTNASSVLKQSWFDFGFNMLGFTYANEDKSITDDGKNEKGGEGDKHEHPSTSEFDPDKEQEIKSIKIMETENQLGKEKVFEKTDDSDTLPYFNNFLCNFDSSWNFQKETELPFPKHILDINSIVENDETEEFSVENGPIANMKIRMLKSRFSQSGWYKNIYIFLDVIYMQKYK